MSFGEGLPGPGEGLGRREHGPLSAASLEDTMSQFAEYVVNRLFSVGLSLESAPSIVGEGPAGDRVAAATGEVDRMIRDIRTITFGRAADRGNQAPDRRPVPPGGQCRPAATATVPGNRWTGWSTPSPRSARSCRPLLTCPATPPGRA